MGVGVECGDEVFGCCDVVFGVGVEWYDEFVGGF